MRALQWRGFLHEIGTERVLLERSVKPIPDSHWVQSWFHCLGDPRLAGSSVEPTRAWCLEKASCERALRAGSIILKQDGITQDRRNSGCQQEISGLTVLDHLKRFCLLCIFHKGSDRISSKLAHPPFCLACWFLSLIWGRLLAWLKLTSVTKRLVYMPLMFFILMNAKYLSSTTHTLAKVPEPMRTERIMRNRNDAQGLLWTLIVIGSFWTSELDHA